MAETVVSALGSTTYPVELKKRVAPKWSGLVPNGVESDVEFLWSDIIRLRDDGVLTTWSTEMLSVDKVDWRRRAW